MLKPGVVGLTVTGICRVCVALELLPVMVMEPVVAVPEAFTFRLLLVAALELIVTVLGDTEHVRPVVPVQLRPTLPEKPWTGVIVIVSAVKLPWLTLSEEFAELSWKSGFVNVTLMVAESVRLPLVPVTVSVPVAEVVIEPGPILIPVFPEAEMVGC